MPMPGMGWGEEYQPMNPNPQWDVEPPGQMHVPQDTGGGGGGGGGSSPWGNLSNIFGGGGGSLFSGLSNLMTGNNMMIPAWLTAYQQWKDADKYRDTSREAMEYGDPFGKDNRKYYQDRLQRSYDNPEEFLNDPGHVAKRQAGIDTLSRQNASKGYLGSGNMTADLAKYIQDQDSQFLDEERKSMQPMTGAQFNPAEAGRFLMQGNQQAIDSQNAALGSMMYPFGPGARDGRDGRDSNGNTRDSNGNITRLPNMPDGGRFGPPNLRNLPLQTSGPYDRVSMGPDVDNNRDWEGGDWGGYREPTGSVSVGDVNEVPGMGDWQGGDWGGGDFYPTSDWDWSGWDY